MTTKKGERVKERRIVYGFGFAMIYHAMTRDKRISNGAFRLYAHYLEFAWSGEGWPGRDRIAKRLDVTPATVTRWGKELIAAGYITRERRPGGKTSMTYIEDPEENDGLLLIVLKVQQERKGAVGGIIDDPTVGSPVIPRSDHGRSVEEEIDEGDTGNKKDPDTPFGVSEDEPQYVPLDGDDWPEEDTRGNLESYIYRQANRRLTPNQAAKMRKPVIGRRQYQSPEQIFSRDDMPLFKRWIDEQIAWAAGANDDNKRMPTGSLVGAIRNYERPFNGWLEFYQKEGELSGDERLGGTGQRTDADRRREAEEALAGLAAPR